MFKNSLFVTNGYFKQKMNKRLLLDGLTTQPTNYAKISEDQPINYLTEQSTIVQFNDTRILTIYKYKLVKPII